MFGDLGKIMKLAKDMKTKMPAMQQELAEKQFTAEAGGQMISAAVNGKLQLVGLKINPELLAGGDVEMVEDLIKAAVAAAQAKAAQAATEMMQELTGGITMPPGMEDMLG